MLSPECKFKTFTRHAIQKMFQRNVGKSELDNVILTGTIIKEYPNDLPYPSFLFLGFCDMRPLHIVLAFDKPNKACIIVTVYEPDPNLWEENYTRRIEK